MTCPVDFKIQGTAGQARAATLTLNRGTIQTPVFMPVGTQGAIRTLSPMHLAQTGSQIILANTYHLHQRPGEDLVAKHGGLHDMMQVELPILTDSGGFQVFSLDKKSVNEDGVTFTYEVDGRRTFLSPETSMDIQQKLGADIAMVFDECLAFGTDRQYTEASVARTTRWERRSKEAHTRPDQSLFGIVQGGFYPDLRQRSAEQIQEIGFDGYAIGGLSVGEGHSVMVEVLDYTTPHMPKDAPRYLMGVGRPLDLVEGVARGIDMFDCVIQTRHARSGMFYTDRGRIRITDSRYKRDMYPPDATCSCYACTKFTRAYIHHLFKVGEVFGATLATIHNLTWFANFMARMRQSILDGEFETFRKWVHEVYPERPVNKRPPPKPKGASKGKKKGKGGRGGAKR
ncbi:MAG: tRNA guanosine(34) transglycosylase Tgt [Myxococcota bacterium]|nr:tRNA guanosine(34) transglycosylase Tgt [Myxococcota bacterium]